MLVGDEIFGRIEKISNFGVRVGVRVRVVVILFRVINEGRFFLFK